MMRGFVGAILCGLGLSVASVLAAGPAVSAPAGAAPASAASPAPLGDAYSLATDPVSGAALPEQPVVYQYEGRELRFASQKNVERFQAHPDQYLAKVDAQLIEQQTAFYPLDTCLISGEKFGTMGKPIDVIYNNRLVRFCCPGCLKDFRKDPAASLARLDAAAIAKQTANYPLATCVVSGEKLGGDMGKPVDFVIGNRLVRFCCPGCAKDFSKEPAKYLKALDAAAAHRVTPAK